MNTNDPGREPTDAELVKQFAAEICASEVGADNTNDGERILKAVIARGREYLSGQRPMPHTPAPDEVAQARIAVLAALSELLMDLVMAVNPWGKPDETFPMVNGRQWFDYRSDLARACIEHGHTAFLALERGNTSAEEIHAEFKRLWDGRKEECESLSAANTALTARIADLEREFANAQKQANYWEHRHEGAIISIRDQIARQDALRGIIATMQKFQDAQADELRAANERVAALEALMREAVSDFHGHRVLFSARFLEAVSAPGKEAPDA